MFVARQAINAFGYFIVLASLASFDVYKCV